MLIEQRRCKVELDRICSLIIAAFDFKLLYKQHFHKVLKLSVNVRRRVGSKQKVSDFGMTSSTRSRDTRYMIERLKITWCGIACAAWLRKALADAMQLGRIGQLGAIWLMHAGFRHGRRRDKDKIPQTMIDQRMEVEFTALLDCYNII